MKNIKRDKKGFIPYDYEQACTKNIEDLHGWFLNQLLKKNKKMIYALKEISSGDQFEIAIYPQFSTIADIPPAGLKKDNTRAQKKLNDNNSRTYVERLINTNFTNNDIWLTLTYDNNHLPPNGDIDAAMRDMQNFITRINRRRKKNDLPNCKYIYVTEYSQTDKIRWHHHIIMDGDLKMDTVVSIWKKGSRNEVRRLEKDENGLSGLANYIVKDKNRLKSEKRWKSSKNLVKPGERVVYSKKPTPAAGYKRIGAYVNDMVTNQGSIKAQLQSWYPGYDYTNSDVFYNDFNKMFYIKAKMRKKKEELSNESLLRKEVRRHRANDGHPVGEPANKNSPGTNMAIPLSKRWAPEPLGSSQTKTDGSQSWGK